MAPRKGTPPRKRRGLEESSRGMERVQTLFFLKESKAEEPVSLLQYLHSLSSPCAQIFMKIKGEIYLHWAQSMKALVDRCNSKRNCRFHQDNGHNIKDYLQLKNEIETLIQRGYLWKYVHCQENLATKPLAQHQIEVEDNSNQPTIGIINIIIEFTSARIQEAE